ncbi:MAG: DotI/IcmL/TraM family protein, partial [Pseudomonadota bacterium]
IIAASAIVHYGLFQAAKVANIMNRYDEQRHINDVTYALRDFEKTKIIEPRENKIPLTEEKILSWAEKAVIESMTFGHNFYKDQLKDSSRHFTKKGWESFTAALAKSRIIESMKLNQQDIRSLPYKKKEKTIKIDNDKWLAQIPIATSYTQHNKTRTMIMVVTVVIVKSEDPINRNGIGIEQFIAMPVE